MRGIRSFLGLFVITFFAVMFFCVPANADSMTNAIAIEGSPSLVNGELEFNLRLSVTDALATNGYGYEIWITNEDDFDTFASTTWNNGWLCGNNNHDRMNGETISCSIEQTYWLMPGVTYTIKPVLIEDEPGTYNTTRILEGPAIRYTLPDSAISLKTAACGGSVAVTQEEWQSGSRIAFTADRSDMYMFRGSTWFDVFRTDGTCVQTSFLNEDNYTTYLCYLLQGTTVCINQHWAFGGLSVNVLRATDVIPSVELNTAQEVPPNDVQIFSAPADGFYKVAYSRGETDYFYSMNTATGQWDWNQTSFTKYLSTGESTFFQPSYWREDESKLSILIKKVDPPAANSIEAISTGISTDSGRMTADVRVSATSQLAEYGYMYGVEISNRENFQGDRYSYSSSPNSSIVKSIANEEVFTLECYDMLVPGATYYLKGRLQQPVYDANGNMINMSEVCEGTNVIRFTGPGSDSDFEQIALNETENTEPNKNQFLFTVQSAGMYAVSGKTLDVGSIEVYRSNGDCMASAYQNGSIVPVAAFYANAGEKYYIRTYGGNGAIIATTAEQALPKLVLGQPQGVNNDAAICFTAENAGYYKFAYSSAASDGGFDVLDTGTGTWNYCRGNVCLKLAANETVYVKPNYPQWDQGQNQQRSVVVNKVTPPSANSIEAIGTGISSNGNITVNLRFSATEQLADGRYSCGVRISNRENFQNDLNSFQTQIGESTMQGIANEEMFTLELHRSFVPGVTYYLKGLLQQPVYDAAGNIISMSEVCEGTNVISFIAPGSDNNFVPLALNETGSVRQYDSNQFLFTAPSAGMYAVSDTGIAVNNVEVLRSNGALAASAYQNGGSSAVSAAFYANADEKLYIMANAYNGNGTIALTTAVLPKLILGEDMGVDSNATVCFTAADAGYYTFAYSPANSQYGIEVMDNSTGTWNHYNGSASIRLSTDETVYVKPNYRQWSQGQNQQLSIVVNQVFSPSADSVEVSAATNVTNFNATFAFTVSATEATARDGYSIGISMARDQAFTMQIGRSFNGTSNSIVNEDQQVITLEDFTPGQSLWYKAVMIKQYTGEIICEGSNVYQLNIADNLNGYTALTKGQPFGYETEGRNRFYYNVQTSGVYAVRVTNANSIKISCTGGATAGRAGNSGAVLCGIYAQSGERLYINTVNFNNGTYSVELTDGLGVFPSLQLGQPVNFSRGEFYSFTAPADGEYSFMTDSSDYLLRWLSPEGIWMDPQSTSFSTELTRGSTIWLLSEGYGPGQPTQATLTVTTTSASGLFVFPSSLKTLEAYACAGLNIQKADFSNCGDLESVQSKAFADCSNLTTVVFPKASVEIAEDAFENCGSVTLIAPAGGSVEQFANSHSNICFSTSE